MGFKSARLGAIVLVGRGTNASTISSECEKSRFDTVCVWWLQKRTRLLSPPVSRHDVNRSLGKLFSVFAERSQRTLQDGDTGGKSTWTKRNWAHHPEDSTPSVGSRQNSSRFRAPGNLQDIPIIAISFSLSMDLCDWGTSIPALPRGKQALADQVSPMTMMGIVRSCAASNPWGGSQQDWAWLEGTLRHQTRLQRRLGYASFEEHNSLVGACYHLAKDGHLTYAMQLAVCVPSGSTPTCNSYLIVL